MTYKFIGESPLGINGYPRDGYLQPGELITKKEEVRFIENLPDHLKVVFEVVVPPTSKKKEE